MGRRHDYKQFSTVWIQVPVQYGNLSKNRRCCFALGYVGDAEDPWPKGSRYYYRICSGERGAGRLLVNHIYTRDSKRWVRNYYISYGELPETIRKKIEHRDTTVAEEVK